jgi:hypothetical protein
MEKTPIKNSKKKNRKPIYILFGSFLFFGLFIYFITRPSTQSLALRELNNCFNKKDVEMTWYKYKNDLFNDEKFLFETRKKLSGFNLSEIEIKECSSWLPPAPESINIIVIPDLSRRLSDTINNPNQIKNDTAIFNVIWESFKEYTFRKMDTKDKLIIDVTDIDQAKGQFGLVADNLQFDLSEHKGKSNRLYFDDKKNAQFKSNISKMYKLAAQKPLGADYRFYLRRYLKNHIKKSNLFVTYVNKVIIITDGYLESENQPADTKIYGYGNEIKDYRKILYPAVNIGNILEVITQNQLNIPKVDINLSNVEFLVCEVNERKFIEGDKKKSLYKEGGKGYDFEILKVYWEDWLNRMGCERIMFLQREQAANNTHDQIRKFILNQNLME